MSATCLERREPSRPVDRARQVLPALLDDSRPLRGAVARVLRRWVGDRATTDPSDPRALHDAWRAAVAAVE